MSPFPPQAISPELFIFRRFSWRYVNSVITLPQIDIAVMFMAFLPLCFLDPSQWRGFPAGFFSISFLGQPGYQHPAFSFFIPLLGTCGSLILAVFALRFFNVTSFPHD